MTAISPRPGPVGDATVAVCALLPSRLMETPSREVFNRSDCPYGCGAPLDPQLRWQATPCRQCGRPLYPVGEIADPEGRIVWPPANVPRPPEAGLPGVQVWYVVGDEEAQARKAIGKAAWEEHAAALEERTCLQTCLLLALVLIIVVVVVALAVYFLVIAPR